MPKKLTYLIVMIGILLKLTSCSAIDDEKEIVVTRMEVSTEAFESSYIYSNKDKYKIGKSKLHYINIGDSVIVQNGKFKRFVIED